MSKVSEDIKREAVAFITKYAKENQYNGDIIVYFNDNSKEYVCIPGYTTMNVIWVFQQKKGGRFVLKRAPVSHRSAELLSISEEDWRSTKPMTMDELSPEAKKKLEGKLVSHMKKKWWEDLA